MSETVYAVVNDEGICYGVFTNMELADEVANYNHADVCKTILVHSRQEMYRELYDNQIADKQ